MNVSFSRVLVVLACIVAILAMFAIPWSTSQMIAGALALYFLAQFI